MKKLLNISVKKAILILVVIAVAGVIAVIAVASKKENVVYATTTAKRGSVVQTVSETGTIKSSNEINLSFLQAGQVKNLYYKIGSMVKEGDLLAELDYSSFEINMQEAQANLDVARENLNKLIAGATDEEVTIARASEEQARIAYEWAKNELDITEDSIEESVIQAEKTLNDLESKMQSDITPYEQAVTSAETNLKNTKTTYNNTISNRNQDLLIKSEDKWSVAKSALDIVDQILKDDDGKDLISVKDLSYLADTKLNYTKSKTQETTASVALAKARLSKVNDDLLLAADEVLTYLGKVSETLKSCFWALENSVNSANYTKAEIDAQKTSVSAQQTIVAAAISTLQTASQNLEDALLNYGVYVSASVDSLASAVAAYDNAVINARNALSTAKVSGEKQATAAKAKTNAALEAWDLAQAQLERTVAPANQYDINLYQARIRQSLAALNSISQKIEDSQIKSPIDGTIIKINYEIGEPVAGTAQPVISMLGENNFEIEVLISEADITKVKKGDIAEVTLDAFGEEEVFEAKVNFIEPAETVIQDVIYYEVKLEFSIPTDWEIEDGQDPEVTGERNIKSGMTANVTITTAEKENSLLVPSRAIVSKNGNGKIIRVLENNILVERAVTTGLRGDEGEIEVLSGVREGDTIVTSVKNN